MAEAPLTNIQEPGFFSRIQESPSLFLTPGSVQVVGLIGTGKSTKTVSETMVRGADKSDAFANAIYSVNLIHADAVYRYAQSYFSIAHVGSSFTATGLATKTLIVTVDGSVAKTCTFSVDPANLAAAVIAINASAIHDVITAEATTAPTPTIRLYVSGTGLDGKSFTIGAGTANTLLGFVSGERAKSIRWTVDLDPEYVPQAGNTYYLDYERPSITTDLNPKNFVSLSQVVAEYGSAVDYSIPLGAQAAFGNGCSYIVCRKLDPSQLDTKAHIKAEIVSAMADLEAWDVNILVPMSPINLDGVRGTNSVDNEYLEHVSKMSSKLERKERICILGVDETAGRLTILGSTGDTWQNQMSAFAASSGSGLEPKRIIVVNPGACVTNYKGASITTNGTYLAACLAGKMCSPEYDEAEPMTRKNLATIDGLIFPDLMRSEKNLLTSMGVAVLEVAGAGVRVRRAVTADSSSIASQEPSIVRAFDRVAQDLREALENRYVGTKILRVTSGHVAAATDGFLGTFVANEIIGGYRNISVIQNAIEPRQFDISFEAIPVFPFLWGFLDISINLS